MQLALIYKGVCVYYGESEGQFHVDYEDNIYDTRSIADDIGWSPPETVTQDIAIIREAIDQGLIGCERIIEKKRRWGAL